MLPCLSLRFASLQQVLREACRFQAADIRRLHELARVLKLTNAQASLFLALGEPPDDAARTTIGVFDYEEIEMMVEKIAAEHAIVHRARHHDVLMEIAFHLQLSPRKSRVINGVLHSPRGAELWKVRKAWVSSAIKRTLGEIGYDEMYLLALECFTEESTLAAVTSVGKLPELNALLAVLEFEILAHHHQVQQSPKLHGALSAALLEVLQAIEKIRGKGGAQALDDNARVATSLAFEFWAEHVAEGQAVTYSFFREPVEPNGKFAAWFCDVMKVFGQFDPATCQTLLEDHRKR